MEDDLINEGKPIDNPLDYREDGSIQEGDPSWPLMKALLDGTLTSAMSTQREDGSWESVLYGEDGPVHARTVSDRGPALVPDNRSWFRKVRDRWAARR